MQSENGLILTQLLSKLYKAHEGAIKTKNDIIRLYVSKEEKEAILELSKVENTMDSETLAIYTLFSAIISGPTVDDNIESIGELSTDCITRLRFILGK